MKTAVSLAEIRTYLEKTQGADAGSVRTLTEGRTAQAVRFERYGRALVFRIAPDDEAFRRDQFAAEIVKRVPVPTVQSIGAWNDLACCISAFIEGTPADQVPVEDMVKYRREIHRSLAGIFTTDIDAYTGFGVIDPDTGNAGSLTAREAITSFLHRQPDQQLHVDASTLGLDCALGPRLLQVINRHSAAVSPVRRLLHGDPGFDNMLIMDGQVVAHIDWAVMSYGDWMQDFTRFELWDPARYGRADEFAQAFGLEQERMDERRAVFTAMHVKDAIHFSVAYQNQDTARWLRDISAHLLSCWT